MCSRRLQSVEVVPELRRLAHELVGGISAVRVVDADSSKCNTESPALPPRRRIAASEYSVVPPELTTRRRTSLSTARTSDVRRCTRRRIAYVYRLRIDDAMNGDVDLFLERHISITIKV